MRRKFPAILLVPVPHCATADVQEWLICLLAKVPVQKPGAHSCKVTCLAGVTSLVCRGMLGELSGNHDEDGSVEKYERNQVLSMSPGMGHRAG